MLLKNASYLNEEFQMAEGCLLIKDGVIYIMDGEEESSEEIVDCQDYFVLPGLFNSHFHGYSLLAKGFGKEMKIEQWCNDSAQGQAQMKLFEAVDGLSKEEYEILCKKTYMDMVKNGITFVCEGEQGNGPEVVAKAIHEVGIRGLVDTHGNIEQFYGTTYGKVEYGTHLLEEEDITDETLQACVDAKIRYPESFFLTHCMENDWRKGLVKERFGKSSVALYHERGLLDDKTVLFHGVELGEEDFPLLADTNASIVHCPVSNLWSGAGIAPIGAMLDNGVNVCLATDYGTVDLWETMKQAYYLMKVNTPVSKYSAKVIFKMATKNGAVAFNKPYLGSIANGNRADLIFIKKNPNIPYIHSSDFSTILHNILMETTSASIRHVMVDGQWILQNGTMTTLDEKKVEAHFQEILLKIKAIVR